MWRRWEMNPALHLDAFEKANTDPNLHEPFKNARVLSYRMDAMSRGAELAVFKTDGTAEVYNPFGLKRKYDNYFVMPPTVAGSNLFIAKTLVNLCPSGNGYDFRALISNDGRFYTSRSLFRFYVPGTTTENTSHLTSDQYRIGTGVMSYSYYVFWDEKGKRFIHNTFSGTNYIPPFDTANREDAVLSTPVLDSQIDPRRTGILTRHATCLRLCKQFRRFPTSQRRALHFSMTLHTSAT